MAMFSGADRGRERDGDEAGLSIIANGMRVEGEIVSDGVVKVEGMVVGSVRAERQVLVAKGGAIEGDIQTREAIVGGEVRGAITAHQRVEVQTSAVVLGDITTQRIIVHEGGEVNGHLRMGGLESTVGERSPHDRSTAGPTDVGVIHT